MSEITNDLFISFNWSLNTQIKTLEHNLLQKGLKIFREQKEENIDNPLTSQLASAIQKSKFFLCCINTAYCKSHNCNLQIEYANSLAKPIFTLLIDDLNLEDMSFLVTGRKNTKTRIGSILTNCYIIKCFNDTDNWFNDTSKLNDIKRHIAGDPIDDKEKSGKSLKNEFNSNPLKFSRERKEQVMNIINNNSNNNNNNRDENRSLNKKKTIYKSKYERLDYISAGSFGEVFKVLNLEDLKVYALKITQLDNESVDESTFDQLNEAKLLRSLSSSYIIQYHDCFFENMRIFLVTEYCEDGDIGRKIREKKEQKQLFDEETIFMWSQEMIFGIYFLHCHSIIHRDIKPGNVFLKNGHVKLGDLGCAKNILSSIANSLKGTIKYMSPEMISAKPYDFKTDIWSTGVIIYELITLEYPFKGNSLYELVQSILMDVIPNMNTSKLLKNLVKMMLQRELDVRADSKQLKYFLED